MKNVRLIAKLDDANGKCIICKKDNGNYIVKNIWSYGSTKWHEISESYFRNSILLGHFKMTENEANSLLQS